MYYDYDKLMSYNGMLNFVVAERGVGKTYGAKKLAIKRFLRDGSQFIYVRRYNTELETSVNTFFDQLVSNNEFEGHKFKVVKKNKMTKFYCDGHECGYAISLSTANILKSTSFPYVKLIIFDEFMLDVGSYHYLRSEVTQFLELWETVARLRDVPVIFLGNAVSTSCPYFSYFDIEIPYNSEFKTFKDGLIVFNYCKNEAYRAAKKDSKFGRIVEGTAYGDYAIDNKWLRDSGCFIKKKTGDCRMWSAVVINGKYYGVWRDWKTGEVYVSEDYDPQHPCVFAFNTSDHNERTVLQARRSPWFAILIKSYRAALLYFESQKIKQAVMPVLSKTLTF